MRSDFHIQDQERFLREIPDLIAKLRLRNPSYAWDLDLTPSSLAVVDRLVAVIIDQIIAHRSHVTDALDPDLVRQVTAYVGEVIVRHKKGRWQVTSSETHDGPTVAFPVSNGDSWHKAIDIYSHVFTTIVEGESLEAWYQAEIG